MLHDDFCINLKGMSIRNSVFGSKTSLGFIPSGKYFCLSSFSFVSTFFVAILFQFKIKLIFFNFLQAREEYRFAKYKKQVEWAIMIIQRCYVLWKRRQYLLTLPIRLHASSMSPICTDWPSAPRFLLEASQLLKNIFHRWRVR